MSGDFLSMRMIDEKIKDMRKQREAISKTAKSFDKGLMILKTLQDQKRKQRTNVNGVWEE